MTVLVMSRSEIDRMEILRDLAEKRLRVAEAAKLLRLCPRQVLRLAKAYRLHGPVALASRQRGRPSNRSYPAALRSHALAITVNDTPTSAHNLPPRSLQTSMASTSLARPCGHG
jgi:hypothetical protein